MGTSLAMRNAKSFRCLDKSPLMLDACACCSTWFPIDAEDPHGTSTYCDHCEVAYLEFKLSLLAAVYRDTARKADEV